MLIWPGGWGVFDTGLDSVENSLKKLNEQTINALLEDCNEEVCLEMRKVDIKRNEQKDIWMAINNKFDCDLEDGNNNQNIN